MANPSVTYTFINGQTNDGPQVSQNFTDIISALTDASKDLTVATLTATTATVTTVAGGVVTASTRMQIGSSSSISGGTELLTADTTVNGSATSINAAAFRTILSGNTAQSAAARGVRAQVSRTITSSTTDTAQLTVLDLIATAFTVSSGQTLTNTNATGVSYLNIATPTLGGGGSLAVTSMFGIRIASNAIVSGTGKAGLAIGAHTNATNNVNLLIGTTTIPSGSWEMYSAGTGASLFGGSLVIGTAAIGTTATDGFLYLPTCAGTPTGVPTTQTGTAAHVYDTSNNRLYVYNGGGWKSVALS